MIKSLKNTLKHTAIYSFGNLSTKLIGLILLPLFTKLLTPDEYGILAILEISSQFLIIIFSSNINISMMRWCAEEKDKIAEKAIVFTSVVSILVISVFLSVILIPFSSNFSILFFDSNKFKIYFTILFLTSSFGLFNLIPLNLIRLREKSVLYSVFTTIKFTTIMLLDIYFLVYEKMGVEGIILSQLIGQVLLSVMSIPFILKNIVFRFKFKILIEMLRYGLPLVFATISGLILSMGDKFIVKFISGDASVGLYTLGGRVAGIINVFIIQSFNLGYVPIAYKKIDTAGSNRFFSKVLTYYIFILIIAALTLSLFGKELIELFALNSKYWVSYTVVPLLAFAFVFKGMQNVFSLGFQFTKKTSYNVYIVLASAILNVILDFILVTRMGFIGAAIATLISFIFMTILTYIYSQKVYHISFELVKIFKMLIIGTVLFFASFLFKDIDLILRIISKIVLISLFPLLLYFWNFYEEIEIDTIKNYNKKFLQYLKLKK